MSEICLAVLYKSEQTNILSITSTKIIIISDSLDRFEQTAMELSVF